MTEKTLWEKCVEFHGHECGGLAIGFRAALYVKELLGLEFSEDEEIVCVAENDDCGEYDPPSGRQKALPGLLSGI